MPSPLDPRTNNDTSFDDTGRMLAYIAQMISDLSTSLLSQGTVLAGYISGVSDQVSDNQDTTNLIKDRLGDPGSGTNIDAKINVVLDRESNISGTLGDVDDKIGDMPVGYPTLVDLTYSFNQETSVANLATRAWLAVEQGGTSVLDIVGQFLAGKFGGGTDLISIGKWLQGIWDVPPVDVLVASAAVSLSASQTLTIPGGVYGYVLTFTVPGYWGLLSADPVVYQPHIAVAAWRGAFGTVGPVALLATPTSQVYPRPAGASMLDIQLRPGITGTYKELRFLGL
jgi:hypothetical protein